MGWQTIYICTLNFQQWEVNWQRNAICYHMVRWCGAYYNIVQDVAHAMQFRGLYHITNITASVTLNKTYLACLVSAEDLVMPKLLIFRTHNASYNKHISFVIQYLTQKLYSFTLLHLSILICCCILLCICMMHRYQPLWCCYWYLMTEISFEMGIKVLNDVATYSWIHFATPSSIQSNTSHWYHTPHFA